MDVEKLETLEHRDRQLEKAWEEFTDVPMDPETECIEEPFCHFPAGTPREDIWRFFDERYSKGVASLLYSDGVDRTIAVATLAVRNFLCFECDSETCAFNPEGICCFPLVYGRSPQINDDGCDSWLLADFQGKS